MTMTTTRHGLPLLAPGQAQKELFHNESLVTIDTLLAAVVEAVGVDVPPDEPQEGQSWIADAAPTGAWAGHPHALASWTAGGWRFAAAVAGLRVTIRTSGVQAAWDGVAWQTGRIVGDALILGGTQVVGGQRAAIADATGGSTVDLEARASLAKVLTALREHGLVAS